jgi:hypothetical protein
VSGEWAVGLGDIVWWGRWFAGWGILYCRYSTVNLVFFNCLIEIEMSDTVM